MANHKCLECNWSPNSHDYDIDNIVMDMSSIVNQEMWVCTQCQKKIFLIHFNNKMIWKLVRDMKHD